MGGTKIKHIVFDLGNILVDVNYKRFTDAMGWNYDKFMEFFGTEFFREFEIGKHSEETFFNQLNSYIPLEEGDEQRYRDNIHKTFSVRPGTWARMHYLKKYYNVYLFSNTNSLDFDGLDKEIEIKRILRFHYVSHIHGYIKPDPKAYKTFEDLFNVDPAEILFVDDRPENIEGARNAGWHAEVIGSENELFEVLQKYRIN